MAAMMKKRKRISDNNDEPNQIAKTPSKNLSFPIEITEDTLSRLPADVLWKLRSVSDYGNSLVRDSHFVNMQLNQSKKLTNRLKFMLSGSSKSSNQSEKFSVLKDVSVDVKFENAKVYGSCNGLLLLGEGSPSGDDEKLWLVNPSIGQKKNLPKPPSRHVEDEDPIANYGLGYVEDEKEFKVVRIRSSLATDSDYIPAEISVYSLERNKWRKLKATEASVPFTEKALNSSSCVENEGGVFLNNALHWVGVDTRYSGEESDDDDDDDDGEESDDDGEESDDSGTILAFDLKVEEFKNIALPKVDLFGMKVACLGGSLCLITYSKGCCNVWRMGEYGNSKSWMKLFHIQMEFLRDSFVFRPLLFSENWCLVYDGNVHLVNVKKKSLRTVHKFHKSHCDLQAVVYTDCLIPLRRQVQGK